MGKYYDLAGQTFGYNYVIRRNGSTPNKASIWECKCLKCGRIYNVVGASLRSGASTQCRSCATRSALTEPYHGDPVRTVFSGMKQRCYGKNNVGYERYGGRGIKICDEWLSNPTSFYDWAYANGYAKGMSIERLDINGNYCPENCKFIPLNQQSKNRSTSIMISMDDKTQCLSDWCAELGISRSTVSGRVKRLGVSYQEALKM